MSPPFLEYRVVSLPLSQITAGFWGLEEGVKVLFPSPSPFFPLGIVGCQVTLEFFYRKPMRRREVHLSFLPFLQLS